MVGWAAVALGCLTGLGMQEVMGLAVDRLGWRGVPGIQHAEAFLALALAGYVTGYFAPRWPAWHGAIAAAAFILVDTTITAGREVILASQSGPEALPPIDFLQLALGDVAALTGATLGALLGHRLRLRRDSPDRP